MDEFQKSGICPKVGNWFFVQVPFSLPNSGDLVRENWEGLQTKKTKPDGAAGRRGGGNAASGTAVTL